VGPIFFINFLVINIFLVKSLNKRKKIYIYIFGINYCVLELLTIYFSIES
jgi:hypothetical protein